MATKVAAFCGSAVFNTSIGSCAVGWRDRTVTGLQLPKSSPRATLTKLRSRIGAAPEMSPPAWVKKIIRQIRRHLLGELSDFRRVDLALEKLTPFTRGVYKAARQIGPGKIATYGELAALSGSPRAARAVGNALANNPFGLIVPCHRILAANGRLGGFSALGGVKTKARLLEIEGVKIRSSTGTVVKK
jgi:O-6-methylguanine DNA methyltransferase